jgi:ABC-type sulfate/molybdate transport systems ATPase subunit
VLTAFVFSSWFPKKLPFAPYLAVLGPPGSGKPAALRILELALKT